MDSSKLIVAAVQIAIYPRVLRNDDDHRSVRIGTRRVKGVKLIAGRRRRNGLQFRVAMFHNMYRAPRPRRLIVV